MARIRTIKPDFFSNEQVGQLSAQARLLFIGLWTLADREGRLQDRPIRIGAQLFPYDAWPIGDLLENLDEANLIFRYEAGHKRCIQIVNFLKHQHPHPRETAYDLPPPPKLSRVITGNSTASPEITRQPEVLENQEPGNSTASPVDSHVLTMDYGPLDYGTLSPTPLPAEEGGTSPPQETKGAKTTSERESKSRFSLKECEQYAATLKSIKSPKAYAKIIWRSGEDDDAIGDFLGNTGKVMKKQPDKPVDVAEMQRLADELDRMGLDKQAKAVRAGIEASK